ncbi:MAG: hypothetical protein KDB63_10575 [Nocardioidaceae bacterium]|nr:hypothetical protein [Nocardioidaceae bacterium]
MTTASPTTTVPSVDVASVSSARGGRRSPAVVGVTLAEPAALSVAPAAMMSPPRGSGPGDIAAAATQRVTAALASLTTNAQEA